jgi:hypothetical protein
MTTKRSTTYNISFKPASTVVLKTEQNKTKSEYFDRIQYGSTALAFTKIGS